MDKPVMPKELADNAATAALLAGIAGWKCVLWRLAQQQALLGQAITKMEANDMPGAHGLIVQACRLVNDNAEVWKKAGWSGQVAGMRYDSKGDEP